MSTQTIHGYEVEVKNEESDDIRHLVHSWQKHENDFEEIRRQIDRDANQKIYLGHIIFEKRDGAYILRKSSQS